MATPDNTGRFTGRVASYTKHRQGHPPETMDLASEYFGLSKDATILDLGSGTGIWTAQLVEHFQAARIIAVEPNKDMRDFSLSAPNLSQHLESSHLTIVDGTAEATSLQDQSVDAIFAAAAFHWFDGPKTRTEVIRIGRLSANADGQKGVPFITLTHADVEDGEENRRQNGEPDFVDPRWGPDEHWRGFHARIRELYHSVGADHTRNVHGFKFSNEHLSDFYGHSGWKIAKWDGSRELDLQSMLDGLESYSSMPKKGTPEHEKVVQKISRLFNEWQKDGKVRVVRDRAAYYGYVR